MAPLPARVIVPPFPQNTHRRLLLTVEEHGLVLRPRHLDDHGNAHETDHEGVVIRWGVKGAVTRSESEEEDGLDIAGILGIVRLWESETSVNLTLHS